VIVLGMMTGARVGPSELFKIQWTDIDFINKIIRIPNAHKGAKSDYRDVPMRLDLHQHLLKWYHEDLEKGQKFIIAYKGKPVRRIGRAWHNARKRAGILRRIRPYDLRHAFASLLLDNSADIKSCMEIMGHASEKMILKYYRHANSQQRRTALNALPFFIENLTNEELSPCLQPYTSLTSGPGNLQEHDLHKLWGEKNSQYLQQQRLFRSLMLPLMEAYGYGTEQVGPPQRTIDSTWTQPEQNRAELPIGCPEIHTPARRGIWSNLARCLKALCSKLPPRRHRRRTN
jgi:hypothetical protein